jgi:acyl-CoA thioester hydrolase
MSLKKNRSYEFPVTVEFEDVDSYQIVHHTKLIAYLERARLRLFTNLGFSLTDSPVHFVLHKIEMRYLKTAKLLDQLQVSVIVDSADGSKLILSYRIKRDTMLIAKAKTTLACINAESGKVELIPDVLLETLKD